MRDQKCRLSFIPDDLPDVIANLKSGLIVQGRKRFIQKKKLRLQDECANQGSTLPHPAGQLRRSCILKVTESIDVKKLMCPLLRTRCQCVLDFQPKDYIIINRAPFKEFIVL